MVRNRDSNFEREIAVFSYPQAWVLTGLRFKLILNYKFRKLITLQSMLMHQGNAHKQIDRFHLKELCNRFRYRFFQAI